METAEFVVIWADMDLRGAISRYAHRRANGDRELAADACQEAWLKISQARAQQKPHVYRLIAFEAVRDAVARELRYQDQAAESCSDLQQMGDDARLLTRVEAAAALGVSVDTVDRKAKSGALRYVRHTAGRIHFLAGDIAAHIAAHSSTGVGA
jgi:DNA-directed RNA polymerase specialized sigma24 family protein